MNDHSKELPDPPDEEDQDEQKGLKNLQLEFKEAAEKKAKQFIKKNIQSLLSSAGKQPPQKTIEKAVDQTLQNVESVLMQTSGPLPPPEILLSYDKIVPGAGKTIVGMAENEAKHRHKIDNDVVDLEREKIKSRAFAHLMGMSCALIFGLSVIGGGIYLISTGFKGEGLFISGGTLTIIILAFLKRE